LELIVGGVTALALTSGGFLAMIGIGVLLVLVATVNQYREPALPNEAPSAEL
jgi:hypothetical protein